MTKTIWEVIEEHSKIEKTGEEVLKAVLNHYKKMECSLHHYLKLILNQLLWNLKHTKRVS